LDEVSSSGFIFTPRMADDTTERAKQTEKRHFRGGICLQEPHTGEAKIEIGQTSGVWRGVPRLKPRRFSLQSLAKHYNDYSGI
jgi:hypothetical protein